MLKYLSSNLHHRALVCSSELSARLKWCCSLQNRSAYWFASWLRLDDSLTICITSPVCCCVMSFIYRVGKTVRANSLDEDNCAHSDRMLLLCFWAVCQHVTSGHSTACNVAHLSIFTTRVTLFRRVVRKWFLVCFGNVWNNIATNCRCWLFPFCRLLVLLAL